MGVSGSEAVGTDDTQQENKLSPDEKTKQVAEQCRVVAALATSLAAVHGDYVEIFAVGGKGPEDIADIVGDRSAAFMEMLGDALNAMDAADDDIDWMPPIFEQAHKVWPQSKTKRST